MNLIHRFPDSTQCTPALPLDLRCAGICPVPSSAWSAEHWDWGAEHQNWGAEPRNGNTKHQNGLEGCWRASALAAAQRAPGSWRGKGLGMGQRENPNAIHRANFPGAAFVRCLSACTWQRHSPRAISSGHSQHSPSAVPSPARPLQESLPGASG